MSDKRYYWLLFSVCFTAMVIAAIWKYPDMAKANRDRQEKLGEYVYLNDSGIHVSRKCPKLNYKGSISRRIKVAELDDTEFYGEPSYCPHCVSDKDYEALSKIIEES